MKHANNPFPKYSKLGAGSKNFQKAMLLIIIIVCTGFIFYLSMYKPAVINPIEDIKQIITPAAKVEQTSILPTRPEFVDLSMIEEDLATTDKNLNTIDPLDNL